MQQCTWGYPQTTGGCPLISVRLWNFKDWPKINILKGNYCILRIWGAPVCQNLGMILENKVVQN